MSSHSPGSTGTVAAPRMVFHPQQQMAVNLSTSASSGTSVAYQLPTNQMLTSGQTLAHQGLYGIRSTIGARQVSRLSVWDRFSKAYFNLASVLSPSVSFYGFIFMASNNITISKHLHCYVLFGWRVQILRLWSIHCTLDSHGDTSDASDYTSSWRRRRIGAAIHNHPKGCDHPGYSNADDSTLYTRVAPSKGWIFTSFPECSYALVIFWILGKHRI